MKTAYRTLLVALACGLGVWFNAFGETSELPDGYAKREYIQTTGQQYLTPGYIPNENTKYVLDIKFSGTFKALKRGTYGATGSGAANIDDERFSGTGVLNVCADDRRPAGIKLILR